MVFIPGHSINQRSCHCTGIKNFRIRVRLQVPTICRKILSDIAIYWKMMKYPKISPKKSSLITDTVGLGLLLWFIGWCASLVLFLFVPADLLGWILFVIFTPLTIGITVLWFRKRALPLTYYLTVALVWTFIAILFDYLFIVKLFSVSGYYHPTVILYYAETFLIPMLTGVKYHR